MKVKKMSMAPEEQAQIEYAEAMAAQHKATIDYNIMMGYLEDPTEEEDEEDE